MIGGSITSLDRIIAAANRHGWTVTTTLQVNLYTLTKHTRYITIYVTSHERVSEARTARFLITRRGKAARIIRPARSKERWL